MDYVKNRIKFRIDQKMISTSILFIYFLFSCLLSETTQCNMVCFTKSFKQCKICYCLDQNNLPTLSSCSSSDKSDSKQMCLQFCCKKENQQQINKQYFQKCSNVFQAQNQTIYRTVGIAVGIVSLLLILIYLCHKIYQLCACKLELINKCKRYIFCCCYKKSNNQAKNNTQQIAIQTLVDMYKPQSKLPENLNNYCIICFQVNCNILTKCNHTFHIECYSQWIKRVKNCPLCKQTDMDPIKHFCPKCKVSFMNLSISKLATFRGKLKYESCDYCQVI